MTVHRPRRPPTCSSQPWPRVLAAHRARTAGRSPTPPPSSAHRLGTATRRRPKPTIVLVHGAFADSSGWNAVAGRLIGDGYPVIAFSNPLRGPISDARVPARLPRHHRRARSCWSGTRTAAR